MTYPNNIKYPTLRAEMARQNLTIRDMAAAIGTNRDTAGRKLSGKSPLNLDEAFKIANTYFPGMNVEQLFSQDAVGN